MRVQRDQIIGPNTCGSCGGTYGDHDDDCTENPKNLPFEPTVQLRFNKKVLEQLHRRPDGEEKWIPVPSD